MQVWILQWLANGALRPTLPLPLHLNGGIPLYQWTFVSPNLWFSKNYNNWSDYVVLASLQGGNFQGFWYVWGEVSILLHLHCQRSHTPSHCGIKECPNQLWRNARPSWLAFPRSHTTGTIFLLKSKDHDRKLESFPFNTLGFETHCSNSLVLHSYSSLAWALWLYSMI